MEYVTVAQEGFYGLYHVPVKDRDPKKALIVAGGSEGKSSIVNIQREPPYEVSCFFFPQNKKNSYNP